MWLGSGVAVAVAVVGSCSFNLTPGLGTSMGLGVALKKKKIPSLGFPYTIYKTGSWSGQWIWGQFLQNNVYIHKYTVLQITSWCTWTARVFMPP